MKKSVLLPGVVASFLVVGDALADGTGFYVEAGGSWGSTSDLKEVFSSTTGKTTWETDDTEGAKLQLGWDFGGFRTDIKGKVYRSGIDTVNSASVTRDDYVFGSATLNFYYDIHKFDLSNGDESSDLSLTPFVGLGVGAAAGYANATQVAGAVRGEQMAGVGPAGAWTVGALLNVTESVGLTLGYDGLAVGNAGSDVYYSHSAELGLRFTF